jgi:hypothetical protein
MDIVAEHFIQPFMGLLAPVSYGLIARVREPLAIGRSGVNAFDLIRWRLSTDT